MSKQDRIVKSSDEAEPKLGAIVVDRDFMSGDLLASALARDSHCDALSVKSTVLLEMLALRKTDLVVIGADLDLKSGSGFNLAHAVSRAHPEVPIVMLLNEPSQEAVINAFRSGAKGVFSRQQPMSEFLDCVEHVRKGFIWAATLESDILLDAFKSMPSRQDMTTDNNAPSLTIRELQVVQCAAKGQTNRAIASELKLSEHTVKNYLFRAFDKLGVSSRVELLFYLTSRGHTFAPTDRVGAIVDQHQ